MKFLEDLPPKCPPEAAEDRAIQSAFRVVRNLNPTVDEFKSYAALGRPLSPMDDICRFASCSLFLCREKASRLAKMPRMRASGAKFIAEITIDSGSGLSLIKNKHVDFWMYSSFDPPSSIRAVEPVE